MAQRPVALITGASAGLGEQFATLFARDGFDVILTARNTAKLEAVAERLRIHQAKTYLISEDLSKPGAAHRLYAAVKERNLTVNVLVNNAGYGTSGDFLDSPLEKEAEMVNLNCTALLELCHLFGREMRERKDGKILNIASTAGFQPGPYMSTYYATKAFVLSFSEGLAHELRNSGVTVTCHCPGATHTSFAATAGIGGTRLFKSPTVATAEAVAADAYEAMQQGEVLAIHGFLNAITAFSTRLAPRKVLRQIAAAINSPPEA